MSILSTFVRRLRVNEVSTPYALHLMHFSTLRGMVVGSWAGIESCIDQANHAGWLYTGKAIAAEIPVNFKRKVVLFRKLHRDTAMMKPIAEQADSFIERLLPLLDDRHTLVHGYLVPDESDRAGWCLERHEFSSSGIATRERYFTCDELEALTLKLIQLQSESADYVRAVTWQMKQHYSKDSHG